LFLVDQGVWGILLEAESRYCYLAAAGLSWKLVAIIILGRENKKRLSFVFFIFERRILFEFLIEFYYLYLSIHRLSGSLPTYTDWDFSSTLSRTQLWTSTQ
jgi:hypothetical protein